MSTEITHAIARDILDSRGTPTVDVAILLAGGRRARATVPSGASTGSQEAVALRDGDPGHFGGTGVLRAIRNITDILGPNLQDPDARNRKAIDDAVIRTDGTDNKSRLGANAILGVSMACAKAAADASNLPVYAYRGGPGPTRLPIPCFNVLNGGVHAHRQGADFQECRQVPYGAGGFREALNWGTEVSHALRAEPLARHLSVGVGDEGGFAPAVGSNQQSYDLPAAALSRAGLTPGKGCGIAIDAASSGCFKGGACRLRTEGRALTNADMVTDYEEMVRNGPAVLREDGLSEDDRNGWRHLNAALGASIELAGGDSFCTHPRIMARGIRDNIANAVLITRNQIGTVSETLAAARLAQCHHGASASRAALERRQTTSSPISPWPWIVAPSRPAPRPGGGRVAKYNPLLRIEEQLGTAAGCAGRPACVRPVRTPLGGHSS